MIRRNIDAKHGSHDTLTKELKVILGTQLTAMVLRGGA